MEMITDLAVKRCIIIALWPVSESQYCVGDILAEKQPNEFWITKDITAHRIYSPENYPFNLRMLEWWEHRRKEDFPSYVKHVQGSYYKVESVSDDLVGACLDELTWCSFKFLTPVTAEEYNENRIKLFTEQGII